MLTVFTVIQFGLIFTTVYSINYENNLIKKKTQQHLFTQQDLQRANFIDGIFEPLNTSQTASDSMQNYEGNIQLMPPLSPRLAIKDENKRWSNGRIPYIISEQFSAEEKALISKGIQEYHERTCIKFVPKGTQDKDYIKITPGQGCNSPVGRQGGEQNVTLGSGCFHSVTILHELMHSLGFEHEHNRPDRDDHLIIHPENIRRGMEYAFRRRTWDEVTSLGFPYDHNSVMQYEETAFSKNGKPTMEAKVSGVKLGAKTNFSQMDVQKINKLYRCESTQLQNGKLHNGTNEQDSGVCPQLKWKTFNASDSRLFTLMVNAGNDSFGNKFYICRSRVINGQMKPGQMFNSKCFISHNGSEYAYTHFQVLTNPNKINMKWHHVSSQDKTLPSNAVAVEETAENGSKNTLYIGRCQIRMLFYQAEVIGYSSPSEKTIDELHAPFDGKQISCQYYQLLICN